MADLTGGQLVARVLKQGGRIGISDVVTEDRLTVEERCDRGSYVGCIAGALSVSEYIDGPTLYRHVRDRRTYQHDPVQRPMGNLGTPLTGRRKDVLVVKDDQGTTTEYYITKNEVAEKSGEACTLKIPATVTGTVSQKDGKTWLTASKIEKH
mgnify:CR=1 FL=1